MGKSYTTPERKRKVVDFELDGRTIQFTAHKTSTMLLGFMGGDTAAVGATLNWLSDGLSEEDNDWIVGRLQDPEDDLDFDTLQLILEDLIADVMGRPTKPRRGFSR
jgi:hypothetical protein